jgi:hypothetical protein
MIGPAVQGCFCQTCVDMPPPETSGGTGNYWGPTVCSKRQSAVAPESNVYLRCTLMMKLNIATDRSIEVQRPEFFKFARRLHVSNLDIASDIFCRLSTWDTVGAFGTMIGRV